MINLEAFPQEIIECMFTLLSGVDLARLRLCSKSLMRAVAGDPSAVLLVEQTKQFAATIQNKIPLLLKTTPWSAAGSAGIVVQRFGLSGGRPVFDIFPSESLASGATGRFHVYNPQAAMYPGIGGPHMAVGEFVWIGLGSTLCRVRLSAGGLESAYLAVDMPITAVYPDGSYTTREGSRTTSNSDTASKRGLEVELAPPCPLYPHRTAIVGRTDGRTLASVVTPISPLVRVVGVACGDGWVSCQTVSDLGGYGWQIYSTRAVSRLVRSRPSWRRGAHTMPDE